MCVATSFALTNAEAIPSAEPRADQRDSFDFAVVSPLVDEIIENRLSRGELVEKGVPKLVVDDTLARFRNAEYKRRRAPPGASDYQDNEVSVLSWMKDANIQQILCLRNSLDICIPKLT